MKNLNQYRDYYQRTTQLYNYICTNLDTNNHYIKELQSNQYAYEDKIISRIEPNKKLNSSSNHINNNMSLFYCQIKDRFKDQTEQELGISKCRHLRVRLLRLSRAI